MQATGQEAYQSLGDRDALEIACRTEVFDYLPIDPSPRPDARAVQLGRGVVRLPTTWREILLSTVQVGRPMLLWLALYPDFAMEELYARLAPLRAYLGRGKGLAGRSVIQQSSSYRFGTESTERAAFAYRLGMTMADWLCVGRLGMSSLSHLKLLSVAHPIRWASLRVSRSPDLVARRPNRRPAVALIEAKCGKRLGLRERQHGAGQLDELRSSGIFGNYLQVLCGVSIEPELFLLVDIGSPAPLSGRHWLRDPARWPGPLSWHRVSPVDQFWRRLLTFRLLQASGSFVRIDSSQPTPDRGTQLLRPEDTRAETPAHGGGNAPVTQILATDIPGTGVMIGLSGYAFVQTRSVIAALQEELHERRIDIPFEPDWMDTDNAEIAMIASAQALASLERLMLPSVVTEPLVEERTSFRRVGRMPEPLVKVEELVAPGQTVERLPDPSIDGTMMQALDASGVYLRVDETWTSQ
jgi:hypothetical protein